MTTIVDCPFCNKRIGLEVIKDTEKPFTESKASDTVRKTDGDGNVPFVNTEQAKNMKTKINIEGTITKKGNKRTINKKDGGTLSVCDAYLKDDAGEIKTTFWGEEADSIVDGVKIRILNGYTNTFKGEVSLTKGKYGKMEILA